MPTDENTTDDEASSSEEKAAASSEELGSNGLKALSEERAARKAAEAEARKVRAELDRLRTASMSEQEKALAEAKAAGRAEAVGELQQRLVRAEVRAQAAGKLADPGDAAALLGDLERFVVNGDTDSKAISAAIDELVKSKPYLAPQGRATPLPGGGATPPEGRSMDDWLRGEANKALRR